MQIALINWALQQFGKNLIVVFLALYLRQFHKLNLEKTLAFAVFDRY
jgi:hypothetical protein